MPSILPTVRPLLRPFFLMWTQSALNTWSRVVLPEMPVTFARAEDTVTGLKMPLPAFFILAAVFLPAATIPLLLCWPFARLPFGPRRDFFFFFFFRFFFFFFAAFFFFFFFFFGFFAAFGFFAFLALLAFFFFACVAICVRAKLFLIAVFTTVVSTITASSSVATMSACKRSKCVTLPC